MTKTKRPLEDVAEGRKVKQIEAEQLSLTKSEKDVVR